MSGLASAVLVGFIFTASLWLLCALYLDVGVNPKKPMGYE